MGIPQTKLLLLYRCWTWMVLATKGHLPVPGDVGEGGWGGAERWGAGRGVG